MNFFKLKNIVSRRSLYWVCILLIGFLFIFLVPPFQKPDEVVHYYRTTAVVSSLKNFNFSGKIYLTSSENKLPESMFSGVIAANYQNKFPKSLYLFELFKKNNFVIDNTHPILIDWSYFFSYMPGVIGYFLFGSYFPLIGFYLARLSFFLFFICCTWWSLKNTRGRFKYLIYMYCCLPMVWLQVTAISYDAVLFGLVPVIFTLILKLFSEKKLSFMDLIIFILFLFWASVSKSGNEIFMILVFLFPFRKLFPTISKWRLSLLNIFLFVMCIGFFGLRTLKTGLVSSEININQSVQKKLLLTSPDYVLSTTLNTLLDRDKAVFYIGSFFGNFGWLDYSLSLPVYFLIFTVILLIGVNYFRDKPKSILSFGQIFFILFFVILVLGIAFGSMFLGWTPGAFPVVEGVQGRYFLPVFIFLLFALFELFLKFDRKKVKKFLLVSSLLVIFTSISITTYKRYYDYSKLYKNLEDLKGKYESVTAKNMEYVILNKETEFNLPIHGEKFSGLQFISVIPTGKNIQVPYSYSISTFDGKIVQKGYIPVSKISGNGVTQLEFGIKDLEETELVLKISPLLMDSNQNYVSIVKNKTTNEALVDLLYVR